ncbi:MAG: asparagine synthase (glutamine-hydrolyzing) [Candidatus Hydrogenedentes bacterium]|nr:asparagine synthase (glutamine-hydrolyzing) [Candidatus Hydrogenedentota bacterium]
MCGIAGIAGNQSPALIERMTRFLAHRGPDGEGFHVGAGIALGHRRLVVLDREGGAQPMHDATGRYTLVYNGEIYNYRALREALRAEGYLFHTQCDTEVVLAALIHWGEAALRRLQGMFAFALWDQAEERLLLARDPLGVKPLYYARVQNGLYFASEMKSILCCPEVSREMDSEGLEDYLTFLYTVPPRTIYRDICQLPAGHCATWRSGEWRERRYWHWPMSMPEADEAAWLERLGSHLETHMPHYAEADVPVGALLSGGLDSACIVAQLARTTSPQTFSIGFGAEGGRLDETQAARASARHFGSTHRELRAEADVAALLPAMVRHFDEPFGNPTALLTYVLAEEVRKYVTVVLSGDGGDEVFGGYRRYQGIALSDRLAWAPRAIWRGSAALMSLFPSGTSSPASIRRLQGFVTAQGRDPVARYAAWTVYHDRASLDGLYAPELRRQLAGRDPLAHLRALATESASLGPVNQAMYLDLNTFLPNNVLRYGDRMSMAHGLELRVPLADPVLASTFLSMPVRFKVDGGTTKVLLREHLKGRVPDGVITRPKLGLNPPMGAWLNDALRPILEDHLSEACLKQRGCFAPAAVAKLMEEHRRGWRDHTWRLWSLIVFEEWRRAYMD